MSVLIGKRWELIVRPLLSDIVAVLDRLQHELKARRDVRGDGGYAGHKKNWKVGGGQILMEGELG